MQAPRKQRCDMPVRILTMNNNNKMDASVIVCTYNRADSLSRTLKSLQAQVLRAGVQWEAVIVDNNSSDRTREVVENFEAHFPRLRYTREPKQGLAHARNHGIAAARGAVLLFTDDDVAPEPDWVQRILDGMSTTGCEACGGYIAPVWESPPPAWLTERFYGFLAIRAERSDTYEITPGTLPPFGANMAFRRAVLERLGGFDVLRGRLGHVLAGGEDIDMFDRVLASGGKVMFFGNARVHHSVERGRLTKRYFRRWRYQSSRNLAERRGFPGKRRLLGIPLYLFPQSARAIARALVARFSAPADEAFLREIIAWHFLGSMEGLIRSRRRL
jgi:glycosyltransferase involved in cell wall biosynthesis